MENDNEHCCDYGDDVVNGIHVVAQRKCGVCVCVCSFGHIYYYTFSLCRATMMRYEVNFI